MQFSDHYQRLGLAADAAPAAVKQAYRRLARRHHPDLNRGAPGAQELMKQINEAYQVLSDPAQRAVYDRIRCDQLRQPAAAPAEPVSDWKPGFPFEQAAAANAQPERGIDVHAVLAIDLADAFTGALREIRLQAPAEGESRQVKVLIPKGVRAGQHLHLAARGGAGSAGGEPGDLDLEIQFKPDERFKVDGADVRSPVALAPWEAALGAEIEVPLPNGSTVRVTIPPDSPHGRQLRLAGLGIPGEPSGDFFLELQVALPPADSPKARALYELMAREMADFEPRAAGRSQG